MENYRFQLLSVKGDIKNQRVLLKFSSDVDEETATDDNIYLMSRTAKAVVPVSIVVERCFIYMNLLKWAAPNEEYSLVVGTGLQNLVGESFESTPPVVFTFKSAITSDVKILYPVNHMGLSDVALKWKEINKDSSGYVGSFYIEIATENAFYNVVYKTTVDNSAEKTNDNVYSIILSELTEDKQYYVRIRAEKDGEYGSWSEVVTFSKKQDTQETIPDVDEDSTGPTIIDYTKPVQQQTTVIEKTPVINYDGELIYDDELPESFEFTSTVELDVSNVKVSVKRKVI